MSVEVLRYLQSLSHACWQLHLSLQIVILVIETYLNLEGYLKYSFMVYHYLQACNATSADDQSVYEITWYLDPEPLYKQHPLLWRYIIKLLRRL